MDNMQSETTVLTGQNGISMTAGLSEHLKSIIGKLVRVEVTNGSSIQSKTGILFDVGDDYLELKLIKNNCSVVIKSEPVKFITVVHDNDINKLSKI